jgi:hypothetical protein
MVYTHARYAHFQGITDLYVQSSIGFTRMKGGQPGELGANSPRPTCVPRQTVIPISLNIGLEIVWTCTMFKNAIPKLNKLWHLRPLILTKGNKIQCYYQISLEEFKSMRLQRKLYNDTLKLTVFSVPAERKLTRQE